MEREDVLRRLEAALDRLVRQDAYLLTNNLGERCIAARLAMYIQAEFPEPDVDVDVEYNRDSDAPKRLGLRNECTMSRDKHGESLVAPDVIVHRRGPEGPNILVLEIKKTANPVARDCDLARIHAFRKQYEYQFAGLIECETRRGRAPSARITEWLGE